MSYENSKEAQRARLLERLKRGPVTTLEARKELDILAPAARIWELKHQFGHNIVTHMTVQPTECGKPHRVGLYDLRPVKQEVK